MSFSNKVKSFFQAVMKPSPAAAAQAIRALKPHVPLIKFRKGSGGSAHHAAPIAQAGSVAASRPPSAPSRPLKPGEAMQLPVIEDWQLPLRYRRQILSDEEIACINAGGVAAEPVVKLKAKGK